MPTNPSKEEEFQIELAKRQLHASTALAIGGALIAIGFGILIAPSTLPLGLESVRSYAMHIMIFGAVFFIVMLVLLELLFRRRMVSWLNKYDEKHTNAIQSNTSGQTEGSLCNLGKCKYTRQGLRHKQVGDIVEIK